MSGTVELHRVLKAPVSRVFKAFSDPAAKAAWLPPFGFTATVHSMEFKVGGTYRMSFTNFSTGSSHAFGGRFLEMEPNKKLRYDDKFDDPNLPGTMITTVELREVFCGTEVNITQEGIPPMILVEACYMGWQDSLQLLAQLVDPEIPDQP